MTKEVKRQNRNQHLNGKIPFRLKSFCGQLKAGFRGAQGIYPSYPLAAAWNANNLKVFLLLIVRTGAAFSCRCLFSAGGEPSLHRAYSIWPGWNRGGTAVRRSRSVLIRPWTIMPFPMACLTAEQHDETICRAANRKHFERRHIPLHRPVQYSCRRHSCSIQVPAYASVGTADSS